MDLDAKIFQTVLNCLTQLIMLPKFAYQFRTPVLMTRLMAIPKNPNISTESRTKLVKIIRVLSATEQRNVQEYSMPIQPTVKFGNGQTQRNSPDPSQRRQPISTIPPESRRSQNLSRSKPQNMSIDLKQQEPDLSRRSRRGLQTTTNIDQQSYSKQYQPSQFNPTEQFSKPPSAKNNTFLDKPPSQQNVFGLQQQMPHPINTDLDLQQSYPIKQMHLTGEQESLVRDYVNMLDPPGYNEMFNFALGSLIPVLENGIRLVMTEPHLFMKCFNLVDFKVDPSMAKNQIQLFKSLDAHMVEARAIEAVKQNAVPRLIKAHQNQAQAVQPAVADLFETIIKFGKKALDVNSLILLSTCSQPSLAELGMNYLNVMTDEAQTPEGFNESHFEKHITQILQACTKYMTNTFKLNALQTIANLAKKESLKPPLVYSGVIQVLLGNLRTGDIEVERIAAKGLDNLSCGRKDLKNKIISEIGPEIKKMHKGEMDGVVVSHIHNIVHGKV